MGRFSPMTSRQKLIAFVCVVLAVSVYAATQADRFTAPEVLARLRLLSAYWWAPLAYLTLYAICNVLFIPPIALSVTATVIWGWKVGAVMELVASTIAAIPPFLIARRASRDWIEKLGSSGERWLGFLKEEGTTALLTLRLVPVIPYTALNYLAGCTPLTTSRYVVATAVGVLPSTFIFAYFTESILAGVISPRTAALRVAGAGALFAALLLTTRVAARKLRRR